MIVVGSCPVVMSLMGLRDGVRNHQSHAPTGIIDLNVFNEKKNLEIAHTSHGTAFSEGKTLSLFEATGASIPLDYEVGTRLVSLTRTV